MNNLYKKASFKDRFLAFIIDQLVFLIPFILYLYAIFIIFIKDYSIAFNLSAFLFSLLFIVYNTLFIWRSGATIGKRLLKIKVVNDQHQSINFWRALSRESIGKFLSIIFYLGYLWVLIDTRKQGWHDKLAKTFVLKLDKNRQFIPIEKEETIRLREKLGFSLLFLFFGPPILLIPLLVAVYFFIAQPFQIIGNSMAPNYQNSQYYIAEKISYRLTSPKRRDVVVFENPKYPDKLHIMRLVGLPGNTISLKDGIVYINKEKLDENLYLKTNTKTYGGSFLKDGQELTIPQNHYFVLGDNRTLSSDSRAWGFIPQKNIIGKITLCSRNCSHQK